MASPSADPAAEYRLRLVERRSRVTVAERSASQVANARLVVFLAGVVVAYLALSPKVVSPWFILLPAAGFLALVVKHDRLHHALIRLRRAVAFYERGEARLEDRWQGGGVGGDEHAPDDHPYAADLDLFGRASLFELLNLARTRSGEETLAAWLLAPAALDVVRARQQAVGDLRDRLDLREDLAILGSEARTGVRPASLVAWGEAPAAVLPGWLLPAALAIGLTGAVTLVGWLLFDWAPTAFVVTQFANIVFQRAFREPVSRVLGAVTGPGEQLRVLAEVLTRVEREPVTAPRLTELRASLSVDGVAASQRIGQLRTRVQIIEARANQLFAPLAWVLAWSVVGAIAIEGWRRTSGSRLGAWLAAVGELEALSSLAGYAYEHPADPFPVLEEKGPLLRGEAVSHPLLPVARAVPNDIALGGEHRLLLVSGSNMSGKSTFLRTLGINVVLAQAGAPVRARSLSLSALAVGATLRIQDSLESGASRFYAEITRLKQILDLAQGQPPLFFLLDEVLAGTNSHDRLQGAEALIRALVDRNAIGLVTTHDLALAQVAEAMAPRASNAHFEDRIEGGKMLFDYQLRAGVVTRSNALALMRAVGLPL